MAQHPCTLSILTWYVLGGTGFNSDICISALNTKMEKKCNKTLHLFFFLVLNNETDIQFNFELIREKALPSGEKLKPSGIIS